MNRIFAIGDIHGCFDQLQTLMQNIRIDRQSDTLVFIGDYIDRGKAVKEVVDYVIGLKNELPKVICLLGNHERMFLDYLEGREEENYLYNGGNATLASYSISRVATPKARKEKVPAEHMLFFRSLLPSYTTADYIFVHAGLAPGLSLAEQAVDDLLWIRQEFIYSDYDFGKTVVFGHTPLKAPMITPQKIGIDTGAVMGGKLTCVELPRNIIHQA